MTFCITEYYNSFHISISPVGGQNASLSGQLDGLYLFEGDILMDSEATSDVQFQNDLVSEESKKWKKDNVTGLVTIPYILEEWYDIRLSGHYSIYKTWSEGLKQKLQSVQSEFENKTCIRYVNIFSDLGKLF